MNHELEYLSDESLEELVALVEQQELVAAPPDMKECILGRVKTDMIPVRNKEEEFRRYCVRVWTSVAAAVVLVFTVPAMSQKVEQPQQNRLATVLGGNAIFSQKDVFHFFNDGGR